jgi:hypothetical protein
VERQLLRAFLGQIQFQSNVVVTSANSAAVGVAERQSGVVFVALQGLLNGAAGISKICWGLGGKRAESRRPVREAIGIRDDSPLRDVDARNHFEHFDQRIEDVWWPNSQSHSMAELSVGPIGVIAAIAPVDRIRFFDPHTGEVYLFGENFNVDVIVQEVKRLQPSIDEANMSLLRSRM